MGMNTVQIFIPTSLVQSAETKDSCFSDLGVSLGRVPPQGVGFVALSEGKTRGTQLVTICNLTTKRH